MATTVLITPEDLAPFAKIDPAKAAAMIADATARAVLVAPCLKDTKDEDVIGAARAVLRRAILRWNDAGSGGLSQVTAGAFSLSQSQQQSKSLFWPSEIEELQGLCAPAERGGAYAVDTAPVVGVAHSPTCTLRMGGTYCSCGADIAGFPLFEQAT